MPDLECWTTLSDWWLIHKAGANTPNWDIALHCNIENRPGLVLVEAKANWPELSSDGKILKVKASSKSRDNHERIRLAIGEAQRGWKELDAGVNITLDTHYQLANRLAFAWKIASLGVPVVLVYLGFLRDSGITDAGKPFVDASDWQLAFGRYTNGVVPASLFGRRLEVAATPIWLLERSRDVIAVSPPEAS
jgi:hypothetical protein